MKTLILGLGNTLLGDDGVGVHVVRRLEARCIGAGFREYMDGGTLSFTLAGPIEDADRLIVIDAAQLGEQAGSVRLFSGLDMDRFITGSRKSSVHSVSLVDLLAIGHLSGWLSPQRALVGIQPGHIDWSDTLSASVARAVPVACEMVDRLTRQWMNEETGGRPCEQAI